MKKKVLSALLITAMATSLLAGCGAKEDKTDGGAKTTENNGTTDEGSHNDVTLKTVSMFGGTDPQAEVYQGINEQFMKDNDWVTIEDDSQSSDEEWKASVAADFAVGNEPDVIQFFTDATANDVLAANKFVTIEEIQKEYPEYAQDIKADALAITANPDGVQRAVPTTGYWEGLFCNKDLFDQYDLELPTDWDSMVTAINTFKENGIIPIACSLNNVPHYWIEFLMLYAAGPDEYTQIPETAPEGWVKGLETFKTLRDLGAFPEDTDTVDNDYTGQLFLNKQAAMQLDGSWFSGQITDTDNTVVVAFPGVEGQKADAGSIIGGISSGFYITKKAWDDPDKREAAVKFVEAHTNKDSIQKYWESTGAIANPAAEVTAPSDLNALQKSAMEYTNAASSISTPTDSRLGQEPYAVLTSNVVKISTGAVSAEDVINEALEVYTQKQ